MRHASVNGMRIALIQDNPIVGALEHNERQLLERLRDAEHGGAELAVGSELCLLGYPPRDLLSRPGFLAAVDAATARVVAATGDVALAFGTVGRDGGRLFNHALVAHRGRVIARASKHLLPTYDVFDEQRYFSSGLDACRFEYGGRSLILSVCEDAWHDVPHLASLYDPSPLPKALCAGADLHVNLSASPFARGKPARRERVFSDLARKHGMHTLMVNQVGANDELVFDGASALWDQSGECVARAKSFATDLLFAELPSGGRREALPESDEEAVYRALVLGIRDYARKCGFTRAVLGLSGGIDSALVAVLAADALGPDNVLGVGMPSAYSSQGSIDDARQLASNLHVAFELVSIEPMVAAYRTALTGTLDGLKTPSVGDTTWENVQARVRGMVVMAVSNRTGALPLTTGNKSELAVGYCTLYGDMAGGLAVLSDLPKTFVYRLANWINRDGERIPRATLQKPPSAELRPDQKDSDSLPDYALLDEILERYVELHESPADMIASGLDSETVHRVVKLIRMSEHKRRQAAPGLIVTQKAFGVGRRVPVAQGYQD